MSRLGLVNQDEAERLRTKITKFFKNIWCAQLNLSGTDMTFLKIPDKH